MREQREAALQVIKEKKAKAEQAIREMEDEQAKEAQLRAMEENERMLLAIRTEQRRQKVKETAEKAKQTKQERLYLSGEKKYNTIDTVVPTYAKETFEHVAGKRGAQ
ncbi:hypothetical protein BLNAU_10459 [Blattamonas nauphoetae]|uniref:Uncharacterized protein n=1 Tax=Blattamonas nauphoetae TaxID=2049346 RepID=A0ABQ9XQD3_9EUKA|nr:hypothetical protein BLNAU_10459 [Blattamonas nauphoetae]